MGTPVTFGTIEVYEEMARLLNDDPEWTEKGANINYSMIFNYGEPIGEAFLVVFDAGRVTEVSTVDPEERPADFVISGPPDVWRGVITKEVNPTAALTRGQLKLKGKMSVLLKNMEAFGFIIDKMTQMELKS